MKKHIGNGTTLKISTTTTAASSAGTLVGGILSISGPEGDAVDVDTMTLDSTSNDVTFQKGFGTAGDITLTIAYNQANTGWAKLKAMRAATTIGQARVDHPSSTFAGETSKVYVKGVGRAIERDSMITRTVTLHCSSGPGFN